MQPGSFPTRGQSMDCPAACPARVSRPATAIRDGRIAILPGMTGDAKTPIILVEDSLSTTVQAAPREGGKVRRMRMGSGTKRSSADDAYDRRGRSGRGMGGIGRRIDTARGQDLDEQLPEAIPPD